ncbi:hypothetical protein Pmar_PMAR007761 [Perkinsus marinus ATCC 50983]|uniref:Uncharacterized protein n=1 Tax=Perkinsus marinus (strain ATCC 50983 / TXsc) TaxID=423536 RepID=C5KYS5_PERM5|nr:hypothetical protein Pmar_PMAR007761 [Perkinsus marinus ATCC 50983]EER10353.1 hypothetical protein Pmar_PMAR007761 [Perkinsus marinus ATCC 50983]|eukprot:XP_002778558.1 hypothetical protein Pmar_PMAR007761 [Perkinsus marinus ATCC 50983]
MIKSKSRLTSRASSLLDINLLGRDYQRLRWQPDISFVLASSMFTADRESTTPFRPWVLSSANKVEYPVINLYRSQYVESTEVLYYIIIEFVLRLATSRLISLLPSSWLQFIVRSAFPAWPSLKHTVVASAH